MTFLILGLIAVTLASLYYLIPAAWVALNNWADRDMDHHIDEALNIANEPAVFDAFARSLPLDVAIWLMPGALGGEVEEWLSNRSAS